MYNVGDKCPNNCNGTLELQDDYFRCEDCGEKFYNLNTKTMDNVLLWLDGNKMKISAILSAVIGYLVLVNVIDGNAATLIITIINILGGSASVITGLAVQNNSDLGIAIRDKRLKNLR